MSLSKLMAGRKRDSAVWDHCSYYDKMDKSRCLVQLGNESRKQCDAVFAGKNIAYVIVVVIIINLIHLYH